MEVLFFIFLFFAALILFFRHNSQQYDLKIEQEKRREETLKENKRKSEVSNQISQFDELKKEFKNILNLDIRLNDYRDWLSDRNGNPGETFIGFMIRNNRTKTFNVKIEDILEKCNLLTTKEVYSITPKGRGVNISETQKYYRKFYWEDRKQDFKYD